MAIIYSYPIATPQDTDLLIISRTPTDPDEISNYSVDMSSVADYVIDKAFNGTDRYIPRFDGVSSLVNSVIYEDSNGNIGIGKTSPSKTLDVNGNARFTVALEVDGTTFLGGPITCEDTINMTANGRIINLEDPQDNQDAATKFYVDSQNTGQVTGAGTTNTLPVWTDGPNRFLNNSSISQILDAGNNVKQIDIVTTSGQSAKYSFNGAATKFSMYNTVGSDLFLLTGDNTGFYQNNFNVRGTLAVGRSSQAFDATLDVGNSTDTRPAAWFRNGVVISNNPAGVQVDNTSMVIGAGNNDNVSGSDHCLIVGSGNQITSNSDQSVAFGQLNTITGSIDSLAVGNSNSINSAQRVYALGYQNTIDSGSSFVAGGQNTISEGETNIVVGFGNNSTSGNNFVIGNNLNSSGQKMILGFRNNVSEYPATDPQNGLSEVKFAVATGATTNLNSNALLITAGGKSGGAPAVPQIPRVILPTVVNFNFADDTAAAAGGIPVGGLYHNAGVVRIRLT